MSQTQKYPLIKALGYFILAISCFAFNFAFAESQGLGGVAEQVTGALANFAKLITGVSFLAGLAFAVTSVLKFKAYKDNPNQTPIGTPIMLMFVAVGLLFLPTLFEKAGETLFGTGAESGSIAGMTSLTGSE